MTFSKDLKPKGAGGALYSFADLKNIQAEIDTLKSAVGVLQNKLTDMADLVETGTLKATDAVQTDQLSANLAVLGTAVVEGELAVSNGSGNDKDVLINRNGVPEWGTPTDINAVNVLVTDTVTRATTVDHTGTVNEADSVGIVDFTPVVNSTDSVTNADSVNHADVLAQADTVTDVTTVTNAASVTNATTVTNADTVTGADTVNHADVVKDAQITEIQHDFDIQGDLNVTGSITQVGATLDSTYIKLSEKGVSNGVATLDSTGRVPASQLTIDAMEYKGKWDASTNTPTLADGVGTDGDFYIVSVAGSQDLGSGTISFNLNDRVLYNGSEWERISSGQVDSVNGATGDVVLTGEDIAESTSDNLKIDRRLKNWLYVDGQGANATKTARGYFSADGIALITFDSNNVYQDAFSLTINGVTCQVYLDGAPTSSTNYTLLKGTYIVKPGIIGLTPYYTIETSACVLSARKALEIESSKLSSCGLLDLIYPVGSLYWSSKSTNPGTLFGGTWTRIKDKFLWAMGDTDTVNATGGAKTVSLLTANLPSHHHSFTPSGTLDTVSKSGAIERVLMKADTTMKFEGVFSGSDASDPGRWSTGTTNPSIAFGALRFNESHSHTFTGTQSDTGDTGSGTAHENMPPYICKYCWERTA